MRVHSLPIFRDPPRHPPQYNTRSPNSSLASDNSAVDQTSSGYANWRLSLFKDRLSLVAGMRYEYYNEVLSNLMAAKRPWWLLSVHAALPCDSFSQAFRGLGAEL